MIFGILYLFILLAGIIFAILYVEYYIVVFVGSVLLFPVLRLVLNAVACWRLKVEIVDEGLWTHQGEAYEAEVHIKNRSIFPILHGALYCTYGYQCGSRKRERLKFQIRARGEVVKVIKLQGDICGTVNLSTQKILVWDYLHLLSFRRKLKRKADHVIVPTLRILPLDIKSGDSFYNDEYEEFYQDHPGDDPSEVFDVREYREGDKIQRIHWKLSSKKEKIMVKEYSDPIVVDCAVVFDNTCNLTGMDYVNEWGRLLEQTAHISYSLLAQGKRHYIYWYDEKGATGQKVQVESEEDFHRSIIQIMKCENNRSYDEYLNYLVNIENISSVTNIFYVGTVNKEKMESKGLALKVVKYDA